MAREYFEKKSKFDSVFLMALYAATVACIAFPYVKEAILYIVCFPILLYTLVVIMITHMDISTELVAQSRYIKPPTLLPTPTILAILLIPSLAVCSAIAYAYFSTFIGNRNAQPDTARAIFYSATVTAHIGFLLFGARWRAPFEKPIPRRPDQEIIEAACKYYGFKKRVPKRD
ncbi:MAG: hypothetical protein ABI579_05910 [Candidatus Sumerlaeota bacterium]